MIAPIPGWSWEWLDGGALLIPPEGPTHGAIHYHERCRPLRRVSAIVRALAAADARFAPSGQATVEPLVTGEGEYGALVSAAGRIQGQPAQRTLGLVFGDDFYAKVSGLALRPDQTARFAATVQALARGDRLRLGVRRRRYLYRPPAGWEGVPQTPFLTLWIPPGFPRDPTMLLAYPAVPIPPDVPAFATGLAPLAHEDTTGFVAERVLGPRPIPLVAGMEAVALEVAGRLPGKGAVVRDVVLLHDDRFVYPLALETVSEPQRRAHLPALERLGASIEPIPRPQATARDTGLLDQWL